MDLLDAAREAAYTAGTIITESFHDQNRLTNQNIKPKGKNDFVTRADQEAECAISAIIHRHFPDHQILAEEGGRYHTDRDSIWIIDPLDGTANFIQGIPHFAVSIGFREKNVPTFGLILNPILNELFYAQKGQGSFFNGNRIQVSATTEMGHTYGATGFPFKMHQFLGPYFSAFQEIFKNIQDLRRCGSAALDLAYTACGRYDFFWEAFLQPWDFAAGQVLIEEAGGRIGNFAGLPLGVQHDSVLAANSFLYPQILRIIQNHFKI